jgi:hypothetical protein
MVRRRAKFDKFVRGKKKAIWSKPDRPFYLVEMAGIEPASETFVQ